MRERRTPKTPKKKVAWALALAFAAPAFAQSVTIAGRVDMGLQRIDDGVNTQNRLDSGTYTASRLIFRGTEDLGGGLNALFYLESGLNADVGAQQSATKLFNRGSYVGIGGTNYGLLTLGRQYVPIFWPFLFGDDTGPLRLHGYSAVQSVQRSNFARVTAAASPIKAAGLLDTLGGGIYALNITSAFEDNLLIYKSPTIAGGLTITGAYGLPEGYTASGKVYGANAEYRQGALYVGYGFNRKLGKIPAGGTADQTMTEHVVTGMYSVTPDINLWGNVHPWSFDSNGTALKGHDFMLGVSYRMPTSMVWANVASKSIGSGCIDCGSKGFGVGYHYYLSKKTELYASVARVGNDANAANSLNGFAPGAPGKSVTGVAGGLALTF